MSITALAAVRRLDLTPRDKFVLYALADYANHDNVAWPKVETIATFTGHDRRTILRALAALEERGLVRVERRRYPDGRQASSRYHLLFIDQEPTEAPPEPEPLEPPPPAADRLDGVTTGRARVTARHPDRVTERHPDRVTGCHHMNPQLTNPQLLNHQEPKDLSHGKPRDNSPRPSLEDLINAWNEERGALRAVKDVPAALANADLRRLAAAFTRRHAARPDGGMGLFRAGITAVRVDPHWLGTRAPTGTRRRDGPAYGLVNYLRHAETKAEEATELAANPPATPEGAKARAEATRRMVDDLVARAKAGTL